MSKDQNNPPSFEHLYKDAEISVTEFKHSTYTQLQKFLNNNYANQFTNLSSDLKSFKKTFYIYGPELQLALNDGYFDNNKISNVRPAREVSTERVKIKDHYTNRTKVKYQGTYGNVSKGLDEGYGLFFSSSEKDGEFTGFVEVKNNVAVSATESEKRSSVIFFYQGWTPFMSDTFINRDIHPILPHWINDYFTKLEITNEPNKIHGLYINFDIDKSFYTLEEERKFFDYYSQKPNLVIQAAIDGIAKDNINIQKNKKADDTIGFKSTAPASTPRFFSLAVANDDFAKNIDYHIQTYAKLNGLKEKDIKTLKSKVQDVLKVSNSLGTKLHFMIEDRENSSKIISLLDKGANVNARDEHQQVPLHFAANAQNPDEQLIKTMLNKGANPNAQKSTGRTPLHFACKKVGTDKSRPHADIASLFIDYGGDPTIKDNSGITPQEEINKGKPQQIVQQPVQQHYAPQPQPVTQVSAYAPQLNSPAININSISNNNHTDAVNVRDHLNRTPIFYAIMSQNIDAVKELLNKGARIDLEDGTGLKPANYARALNNEEIINVLAEHSIKQATQNMGQSTAKPLPPTPPAKARTSTTPPKPAHMEAHRNKEVPTSSLGNLAPKPCPTFRSTNEVGKKGGNEHGH